MIMGTIAALHIRLKPYPPKLVVERKLNHREKVFHVFDFRDMIDVLRKTVDILADEVPDFLPRFEEVDRRHYSLNSHRRRHYISTDREDLYRWSPHLAAKHSYEKNGFWIATNFGQPSITDFVREACEAANIGFGHIGNV